MWWSNTKLNQRHKPLKLDDYQKCHYRLCQKPLVNISKEGQRYCNANCSILEMRISQKEANKAKTKAKKTAYKIFKYWEEHPVPIHKLSAYHQMCIKFVILDKRTLVTPEQRKERVSKYLKKWQTKNHKKIAVQQRTYHRIIRKQCFAKFWDMVEQCH